MKRLKTLIVILTIILCSIHPTTTYAAKKYYRIQADVCYEVVKGEKLPLYIRGYKNSTKVTWKSSKRHCNSKERRNSCYQSNYWQKGLQNNSHRYNRRKNSL